MRKPTPNIDYTNKDYEAFRTKMISTLLEKMPEYTDTSQSDFGIVLIELLSEGLDVLSYMQDSNANECFIPTCQQRSSMDNWISPMGYTPQPATPSKVKQVFVLAFKQSATVTIPKGTLIKTPPSQSEPSVYFETDADLIIPPNCLGDEQDINGNYLYTVPITQGKTITNDPIGYPNGTENQTFRLTNHESLPATIQVLVYNGTSYDEWVQVENFMDSSPSDKSYRVVQDDYGVTDIVFGDGSTGLIPQTNQSPIYANYRVGGGEVGNVASKTITLLDSNSNYIKSTFNPTVVEERGINRENIESIRKNIPISARTRWGLINKPDYINFIMKDHPDKVLAVTAKHSPVDTLILDLYLLPKAPYTFLEVKNILLEYLADRLLIGGSVTINEPTYFELPITLSLAVKDYYRQADVRAGVIAYLADFFKVGNIDFNEEVILSDICSDIKNSIEGIKTLRFVNPVDDVLVGGSTDLIKLTSITVDAIGGDI